MLPSGLRSLLTIGPGPDDGGSKLNQRPHIPDKSGIEVVSAAKAGQANVAAKVNVRAARWKWSFLRKRIAFLLAYPSPDLIMPKEWSRQSVGPATQRAELAHRDGAEADFRRSLGGDWPELK
jgi:hypothetical protein